MESPEIIEKFKERGHPLGRSNVVKQTWNRLWKAKASGMLQHYPKHGYWLADQPLSADALNRAAAARQARLEKQSRQPRSALAKGVPWKGRPTGRRRMLTDEQLARAEEWILEGKMTRAEVARELGGVSTPTVHHYFPGGVKSIQARRQTAPNELSPRDAEREHARLRLHLAEHDRRYYQEDAPSISDAEYDQLRKRLGAIERRFPNLKKPEH